MKAFQLTAWQQPPEMREVGDAYEKMRGGELDGRAVICPHG
jgi:D-arabinose 1-dehydrogenase-like Zn-dependent alcohol dehydrogenase